MTVKLGLPSKGRLQEDAIRWFAERGVTVSLSGADREYAGRLENAAGVDLVLLSAGEIPGELAAGRIHLGVTGQDLIRDRIPRWQSAVAEVVPMGFGRADLVVAVPAFWMDVTTMSDLDSVAGDFRARHGHRLRVATKYHALVRAFFRHHGVADYLLVDSQGATEGSVKNRTAEAIADITTTGATLRDNHLRILDDGLILRSEATLFAALSAGWAPADRQALAVLCQRIGVAAPGDLIPSDETAVPGRLTG